MSVKSYFVLQAYVCLICTELIVCIPVGVFQGGVWRRWTGWWHKSFTR